MADETTEASPTAMTFHMDVEINDARQLYDAAVENAKADKLTDENILEMLGTPDEPDLSACIVQLLDPGMSPPGLTILDSRCD